MTATDREIFDAATVTPEQQEWALDRAINGLRDDDPKRSASKPLVGWQKPVLLGLLAISIVLAVWNPMQTAVVLIGLCTVAYPSHSGGPGAHLPSRSGVAADRDPR